MAHTTLFVRAVYFSSTQPERVHTSARRKRENALTHSLWVCPFVFLRVAKGARIYINALVFAAMSRELIYWSASELLASIYIYRIEWNGAERALDLAWVLSMGDLTRKSREACVKSRRANTEKWIVVFAWKLMHFVLLVGKVIWACTEDQLWNCRGK